MNQLTIFDNSITIFDESINHFWGYYLYFWGDLYVFLHIKLQILGTLNSSFNR